MPNIFAWVCWLTEPNTIGRTLRGIEPRQRPMSGLDNTHDSVLDVREIDGEPFGDIIGSLADLDANETLLLISSFEPVPLYNVLSSRGIEHETSQVANDEWHVELTPE